MVTSKGPKVLAALSEKNVPLEETSANSSMVAYCFATVLHNLGVPSLPSPPSKALIANAATLEKCVGASLEAQAAKELLCLLELQRGSFNVPIFVTWNKLDAAHNTPSLRGCLGRLRGIPFSDIGSLAKDAAFHDPRFPPLKLSEMPLIEGKVSLLVEFEECELYDWDLELNGIWIKFSSGGKSYASTFLPGVAFEHGMTHHSTIERLVQKAKWSGPLDSELLAKIQTTRYRSSIATLSYEDYMSQWHHLFQPMLADGV